MIFVESISIAQVENWFSFSSEEVKYLIYNHDVGWANEYLMFSIYF